MRKRHGHLTTRRERVKRSLKPAEIVAILGAVAGLLTALAHLIQALK